MGNTVSLKSTGFDCTTLLPSIHNLRWAIQSPFDPQPSIGQHCFFRSTAFDWAIQPHLIHKLDHCTAMQQTLLSLLQQSCTNLPLNSKIPSISESSSNCRGTPVCAVWGWFWDGEGLKGKMARAKASMWSMECVWYLLCCVCKLRFKSSQVMDFSSFLSNKSKLVF